MSECFSSLYICAVFSHWFILFVERWKVDRLLFALLCVCFSRLCCFSSQFVLSPSFVVTLSLFSSSQCALLTELLLFSFHFLFWLLPPPLIGPCVVGVVWGVANALDPSPAIWPIRDYPHPPDPSPFTWCRAAGMFCGCSTSKRPKFPPTFPFPDAPDPFALGAVCGRPKWWSKAPAQTRLLKTWKICRPWTPSAHEASVCPSMRCAGRAFLVTSANSLTTSDKSLLFFFWLEGGWGLGVQGGALSCRCVGGRCLLAWGCSDLREWVHAGGRFNLTCIACTEALLLRSFYYINLFFWYLGYNAFLWCLQCYYYYFFCEQMAVHRKHAQQRGRHYLTFTQAFFQFVLWWAAVIQLYSACCLSRYEFSAMNTWYSHTLCSLR